MERLGSYLLVDRIAAGGMAEVHRGAAVRMGGFVRPLAIKTILPGAAADPAMVEMLMDEARICSALTHPNVVQVVDVGCERSRFFMVMEYVSGRHLGNALGMAIKQRLDVPLSFVLFTVSQALLGLEHAHTRRGPDGAPLSIVHRDVSPQNILVGFDGCVKVADFGIARAVGRKTATMPGILKGKAGYMSPEQARGEDADARTDVYAMGVVLWELLARQRLHSAKDDGVVTLLKVAQGQRRTLGDAGVAVPSNVEGLVERALHLDKELRIQTAGQFSREALTLLAAVAPGYAAADAADWMRAIYGAQLVEEEERQVAELQRFAQSIHNQREVLGDVVPSASGRHGALGELQRSASVVVPRVAPGSIRPALDSAPPSRVAVPAAKESDQGRQARLVGIPDPATPPVSRSTPATRSRLLAGALAVLAVAVGALWIGGMRSAGKPPAMAGSETGLTPGASQHPATQTLRFVTSPAGASIRVDGKDLGPAPVDLACVPGRVLDVTAHVAGFAPIVRRVDPAKDGPVVSLAIPLVPEEEALPVVRMAGRNQTSVGRLTVRSNRSALVFVDEGSTNQSAPLVLELAAGEHDLVLMDATHGVNRKERVTLVEGENRVVTVKF